MPAEGELIGECYMIVDTVRILSMNTMPEFKDRIMKAFDFHLNRIDKLNEEILKIDPFRPEDPTGSKEIAERIVTAWKYYMNRF